MSGYCATCNAAPGTHAWDCGDHAREQLARALRELTLVRALHQPIDVPAIPGTRYLIAFTRCSCTPGVLYAECATAAALDALTLHESGTTTTEEARS